MHLEAEIAVPLRLREELVGALTAGPKRSRLIYTAGDAEFLRALAHQTAIALENARTYEALVELNARLEERVRERTAQLESANRSGRGLHRLRPPLCTRPAERCLLGRWSRAWPTDQQPLSFIATSVAPLRPARRAIKDPGRRLHCCAIRELCRSWRAARRTAAIVRTCALLSPRESPANRHLHEVLR